MTLMSPLTLTISTSVTPHRRPPRGHVCPAVTNKFKATERSPELQATSTKAESVSPPRIEQEKRQHACLKTTDTEERMANTESTDSKTSIGCRATLEASPSDDLLTFCVCDTGKITLFLNRMS